jgi:asparagine synthase (glutamine-hydrolysing)
MTQWRMNYWCRSGNQNSMGVPLEFRCPFLDHELVEYAFSLPMSYLIRDGWLKWILRKAMAGDLPPEITWRKRKMGNRYPLAERLPHCKGPLLAMLAGLDCPYLDVAKLATGFAEINRRHPSYLWRLLSLGLWWKKCVMGESLAP